MRLRKTLQVILQWKMIRDNFQEVSGFPEVGRRSQLAVNIQRRLAICTHKHPSLNSFLGCLFKKKREKRGAELVHLFFFFSVDSASVFQLNFHIKRGAFRKTPSPLFCYLHDRVRVDSFEPTCREGQTFGSYETLRKALRLVFAVSIIFFWRILRVHKHFLFVCSHVQQLYWSRFSTPADWLICNICLPVTRFRWQDRRVSEIQVTQHHTSLADYLICRQLNILAIV